MKFFKLASVGGVQFTRNPPEKMDPATAEIMGEDGHPIAYMDTRFDVQAKGSVRTALLERNTDGAVVVSYVKGMWFRVAWPVFDGHHHTLHQIHGLFEVTAEESRQIKGATIQAESTDDLETVLAAFGDLL